MPNKISERLVALLHKIPAGMVVTNLQALSLVGAPKGYARAMPGILTRACTAGAPGYRVVDSKWKTLRQMPEQVTKLRAEGVALSGDGQVINHTAFVWQPTHHELFLVPA